MAEKMFSLTSFSCVSIKLTLILPDPLSKLFFPPPNMATTLAREPKTPPPPPPVIGKAGRYTVFITPPATPRPPPENFPSQSPMTPGPRPSTGNAAQVRLKATTTSVPAPAVKVPPPQFEKPPAKGTGSVFDFFWDAVAKVQNAHSSLDEYLADWFGLNQSKYQWALNDYYENTGSGKDCGKAKEVACKGQTV